MYRFFQIISLFFCYYLINCTQPYFPEQIVFTTDNGQILYAIDQPNQRAYTSVKDDSPQSAYVFQHFPNAPSGSPQSKYYVQLVTGLSSNISCAYGTYWKYGGNPYNLFPSHWTNTTSFQIKNFIELNYQMLHSTNHSKKDEDYWYSNVTCYDEMGDSDPCYQIYFKKNTVIPLRTTTLRIISHRPFFVTTEYQIISIGKPDDKYFANIPKNWFNECLDVNLKVKYSSNPISVAYHSATNVSVSLFTPPHRINGNDTVIIRWNIPPQCDGCMTLTPSQLTFNAQNFNQIQNLTFYRVWDSRELTFIPTFIGGGFDLVSPILNALSSIAQ